MTQEQKSKLEAVKAGLVKYAENFNSLRYLEIYLNEIDAFNSDDTEVQLVCIEFLIRIGDLKRAQEVLLSVDQTDKIKNEIFILKSELFYKLKRLDDCYRCIESVDIASLSEYYCASYVTAFIIFSQFDKALSAAESAFKLHSTSKLIGETLIKLYDEAIIKYELFNDKENAQLIKEKRKSVIDAISTSEEK